jgi:AcrR family transcriptional regulator
VRVAVAIADADGLAAVTMRDVAKALSMAPMSIYTHVSGRSQLVELMVDDVYAGMSRRPLGRLGWRRRVETVCDENRELYQAHPWLLDVVSDFPPVGPGVIAKYDHELRAVEPLGLPDADLDAALTFVLNFVRAAARDLATAARLQTAGGSATTWWEEHATELAELVDAEAFPLATRVGAAAGAAMGGAYDATHAYRFGLARVLDALASISRTPV